MEVEEAGAERKTGREDKRTERQDSHRRMEVEVETGRRSRAAGAADINEIIKSRNITLLCTLLFMHRMTKRDI
jgi:hypothetical protein